MTMPLIAIEKEVANQQRMHNMAFLMTAMCEILFGDTKDVLVMTAAYQSMIAILTFRA